jgi:hypothetical protein
LNLALIPRMNMQKVDKRFYTSTQYNLNMEQIRKTYTESLILSSFALLCNHCFVDWVYTNA